MRRFANVLIGAAVVMVFSVVSRASDVTIVCPGKGGVHEQLAAKEIRRYLYLRTGELLPIIWGSEKLPVKGDLIIAGQKDRKIIRDLIGTDEKLKSSVASLAAQQYQIKTLVLNGRKVVLIAGGDTMGALYGVYRFIEHFGVRFYLHGDTIPDGKIPMLLPELDEQGKPLFPLRGIQPFHDFPEGPDWWNIDDYKAVLTQLPKLRMNFIGLHTYPESGHGPEPLVWIGVKEDIDKNGTPKYSSPARHFTTVSGTWGYQPMDTNDYKFGAAMMYDRNAYGADYMRGITPWPDTFAKRNELSIRVGNMLKETFVFAHKFDIKTCVGTETPLTIPESVKEHLQAKGKDSASQAALQEVYEGMFQWIMKNYPLDYYWLWTPEDWTWKKVEDSQVQKTQDDILTAVAAAKKVKATFTLATCGWVLGPPKDRAQFDNVLPKEMPFSCISRMFGGTPVDEGFEHIKGREKWAIPWMEDDPAMTIPQLWAGRMRQDAADSLVYGCTGLMGIHWRTRVIAPNISALAQAGWDQNWNKDFEKKAEVSDVNQIKDISVDDFYVDWATAEFGSEAAEQIAKIFADKDGGGRTKTNEQRAKLPRPAQWVKGPGGIKPNLKPWEDVRNDYEFVDEMAKLRPQIKGAGNLERFDYWLNNFQYLRAFGQLTCIWGEYEKAMGKVQAEKKPEIQKQLAVEKALPLRRKIIAKLTEAQQYLMATVSTNGELGTVTNWQQHLMPTLLDALEKNYRKYLTRSCLLMRKRRSDTRG